jgi:thiamine-phosphate pyrophosphorylase
MEKNIDAKRIIDANLNRCREGLRVVEDGLRFILNDEIFYKEIRALRHKADEILRDKYPLLIKTRDVCADAGRVISEPPRKELSEIISANFKRVQESLRVLEEYCKAIFPQCAAEFKSLRFAAYNLEKTTFEKYEDFLTKGNTK